VLGGEDGEDEFIVPGALDEFGLAEVGLLAHTEAAAEGRGGLVASVGAGEDAVGLEGVEGEVDQGAGRLGGVAVAGRVGVEGPADLGLAVLDAARG
jgi:hypothetical protein